MNKLRKLGATIVKERVSYAFVAPFYVLFLVFTILPVVISVFLSFTYFNVLEPPKFIGWDNYVNLLLHDDIFITALKNTFVYAVVIGPVSYIASLLIAWMISGLQPVFRAVLVLCFYAPSISGNVYLIWKTLFSGDSYGYINSVLMTLGVIDTPIKWLQTEQYILPIIMLVGLWISFGTAFLSFVAGFQGQDRSLLEAGAVDGIKNSWQGLWYITLPTMRPQMVFGAVIAITNAFAVSDVAINMAGNPSVNYAGHTIVTHLMDYGSTRFEVGYASSIATLLFVIMVVMNSLAKKFIAGVGK